MNKIINYFKRHYLTDGLSYHVIKSYERNPEKLEEILLEVIVGLKKENESLREMIFEHYKYCTNPVSIFTKD